MRLNRAGLVNIGLSCANKSLKKHNSARQAPIARVHLVILAWVPKTSQNLTAFHVACSRNIRFCLVSNNSYALSHNLVLHCIQPKLLRHYTTIAHILVQAQVPSILVVITFCVCMWLNRASLINIGLSCANKSIIEALLIEAGANSKGALGETCLSSKDFSKSHYFPRRMLQSYQVLPCVH